MPPELTPRDGAKIPPRETPSDKAVMAEIEKMTQAEAAALNTLANASLHASDMVTVMAETLDDIKDILIKVCQHTGMPLPKRIAEAIQAGEYDPDETLEDDEDDEDDDVPAKG